MKTMERYSRNEVADALHGSVAKWTRIVQTLVECPAIQPWTIEKGIYDCPLCQLFVRSTDQWESCDGCPISDYTGANFCGRTPYNEWNHFKYRGMERDRALAAARSELEFLNRILDLHTEGTL